MKTYYAIYAGSAGLPTEPVSVRLSARYEDEALDEFDDGDPVGWIAAAAGDIDDDLGINLSGDGWGNALREAGAEREAMMEPMPEGWQLWSLDDECRPLPWPVKQTPAQREIIEATLEKERAESEKAHGWFSVEAGRPVARVNDHATRRYQYFGVFGATAYQLQCNTILNKQDDVIMHLLPAVLDGQVFLESADEGCTKVLMLSQMVRRQGVDRPNAPWTTLWVKAAWLRASELQASNQLIMANIEAEAAVGFTPLTGLASRPEYQ